MEGWTYWIAAVQDEDGLHASAVLFGENLVDPDAAFDALPLDVLDASMRYGIPVQWFGPLTLPAAA